MHTFPLRPLSRIAFDLIASERPCSENTLRLARCRPVLFSLRAEEVSLPLRPMRKIRPISLAATTGHQGIESGRVGLCPASFSFFYSADKDIKVAPFLVHSPRLGCFLGASHRAVGRSEVLLLNNKYLLIDLQAFFEAFPQAFLLSSEVSL